MRKYFSIIFISLFALILTGCGSKSVTCKLEAEGVNVNLKISYDKKDIVTKYEYSIVYEAEDEDTAKEIAEYYSSDSEMNASITRDGKKVTIKYNDAAKNYDDAEEIKIDDLVKEFEQNGYTCK